MIKAPENNLTKKLQAIKPKDPDDPQSCADAAKEHDTVLSNAWKQLKGAPRHALDLFLAQMEGNAVNTIQTPNLAGEARSFAAGQLNLIYAVQSAIDKFQSFNPNDHDYLESEFGDPDAGGPPGSDEEITY
jgi:dsDNA-binding SOS-regulon protein